MFPGNVRPLNAITPQTSSSFNWGRNNGETVSTIFRSCFHLSSRVAFQLFATGQTENNDINQLIKIGVVLGSLHKEARTSKFF